jgi:hypothetical protein
MTRHRITIRLGPTSAAVITNHEAVVDQLREFYEVDEDNTSDADWLVEAMVGDPDASMLPNPWGVGYLPGERSVRLQGRDPQSLAITTRKCVREALIDYCEQRRYVMLHASAIATDDRVIVIVGDKGSGKTTLALKAVLRRGARYISNDHLIVYPLDQPNKPSGLTSRLALTSLPTPIPLKIGTYLDLEDSLPIPWDTEGLDIDSYRNTRRERLYGLGDRVLYTFRQLGQPSPAVVPLADSAAGPPVLVVLASYGNATSDVEPVADPVAALRPHVRTDWMFSRRLNQRYLPRDERQLVAYNGDARRITAALAERATVVSWQHQGDPIALLDSSIGARS